jgi:hypothetical protein
MPAMTIGMSHFGFTMMINLNEAMLARQHDK